MEEPEQPRNFRNHEQRVGGVRLVGLWIPWQAAIGVLMIVMLLTATAVARSNGDEVTFRAASTAGPTTTTELANTSTPPEALAVAPPAEPAVTPESTTTTGLSTTTTAAVARPATPPPTTAAAPVSTTVAPGSAEIVIHAGSSQGNGGCNNANGDWEYVATNCSGQPTMVFTYDPRRYPSTAAASLDLSLTIASTDMTYCFRIVQLETGGPVAGSEKCWHSTVQPPRPYEGTTQQRVDETYGPMQFGKTLAKYAPQVKLTRVSDGSPCRSERPCMASVEQAKVFVEW